MSQLPAGSVPLGTDTRPPGGPSRDSGRPRDGLLRDGLRHGAGLAALVLLCTLAAAAATLALPAALGRALDAVLAGKHATGPVVECGLLLGAAALFAALDALATAALGARTTARLRTRTLAHVLAAGPRAAERLGHGDLVARLVGNAAQAGSAPATVVALAAGALLPAGALVALVLTDGATAVAFAVGLPLLALLLRLFVRASGDSSQQYLAAQGRIAGHLVEAVRGARTVAAAGTRDREAARILAPLPDLRRHGLRMWRVQGRSTAQAATLLPLLQLSVLAVAGLRVASGDLSAGGLLAAWRYAVLATGIGAFVGQLNALVRARRAQARLAEALALPAPGHGPSQLPPGTGELEFRNTVLRREGRTVLNLSPLRLPGGSVTAVVGRSGSGKSSLAVLAGRLEDPDEGVVLLDGVPLPALTHDALRAAVSQAFARPELVGARLRDTIALGVRHPGEARVVQAAREARAHEFIRRLPEGYATPCPSAPLSGGERQRLGLARAFTRPGRLLILDDALSGLDSATGARVEEVLFRPSPGRACLLIAHRARTAARADRVVWLAEGRVRAVGTHAELWRDPAYREVFGDEG
ncbi:ABC transporter transmembrane domain-containing protein [Streptomyces indicus]|uniref:ATP-binding cassette, subfamily B n=1 Tax=Streptomyces indicus TaxID=417292 RepID=A0A1G8YHT0_9ACTN|nr:ABC transporter ATP-binding protein [Streptomyces indicus]SDK01755.1 ATP-binding cassette, subfamily B [Streptomyces indicus]